MKKLFSILFITFGICFAFILNHSSSYAIGSSMTIDYAMWNAYNIAAEYMCGRASRNLQNPDYSDITQISGINNPFSSSNKYGQILWNASGRTGSINQNDVWNAMISDAQELDVSSMSTSELDEFLDKCGVVQDLVGTNWVIKTCQLNGIRFYWATTKAGDWLGTSFANILAKFSNPSQELLNSIQSESSSLYPFNDNILFNDTFHFMGTDNYSHVDLFQVFNFSEPVFIYSSDQNSDFDYSLFVVSTSYNVNCSGYRYRSGSTNKQYFNGQAITNTNSFVINDVTYYYGILNPRFNSGGYGQFGINFQLSSLDLIKSYIASNGFIGDTINSELTDSESVPYSVPEIGELATPITDIYPILESIRQGIISIPSAGELATVLYPSLADAIADAIADAKSSSITIADTIDPSPPNPDDDDDDEFTPVIGWVGDLMPEGMFTMFEPIFSIVPSNYSMYGFWISIPLIIIVCIIIYFIVSVL